MGRFDHLIPQSGAPDAPAPAGRFDHLIPPQPERANPAAPGEGGMSFGGRAADFGRSVAAGLDRGLAGIVGAPADIAGLIATGADYAQSYTSGRPVEEVRAANNARAPIPQERLAEYGGDAFHKGSPLYYEPQTTAGKYAKTGTEFATQAVVMPTQAMRAGLGGLAKGVAAYGLIPGLASEAAGQATEGTSAEPWARAGAGLGAGIAGGVALAPRTLEQGMAARIGRLTPEARDEALARFDQVTGDAASRGIPLSSANAVDFATEGRTNLSGLQRHVEGMGGMQEFYARQPQAVDRAARSEFERIAPITYAPDSVGPAAGEAARIAVEQSPQGRALTQAQRDAGPRVTPMQAGEVIQPDQRRLYDEGVQRREDLSAPLYRAAEQAPERIGVDRMLPVDRPVEPVVTYPQLSRPAFMPDAPPPLEDFAAVRQGAENAGAESFARYVARNGGIALDGDARATDLQRFTIPGFGPVAREGGKSIDNFFREDAIAKGYFRADPDGGAARDISSEVLRKLQNEQRGMPSYPIGMERTSGQTASRQTDEFKAAVSQLESQLDREMTNAGLAPDSLHPDVRSRVLGEMMRDPRADALDTLERVVMSQREPLQPYVKSATVPDEVYAPRFGQVNPQAVIDQIDNQLATARGAVREALIEARRLMIDPATGQTDLSIAGLNGARKAINASVEGAPREVQSALLGVRNRLDAEMSVAPEFEAARSTFEQASRPLDRYASDRPLGQVVEQDQKSGRYAMPPERVPAAIDAGPTAARDLRESGSLASQRAYEGHLRTRLLDSVTDARGDVSAERLRLAIRANEDQLNQFPEVRRQLESIATAREGRQIVERSPIGRLARADLKTEEAVSALFPTNPLANSEREISRTVGQLAQANPWAARQLVRIHAETIFNEAVQKNIPGANQMGGAKFAAVLAGNPQQATNLAAGVRALPNGDVLADGFGRFIDVLEATGKRQNVGSRTAYNAEDLKSMSLGRKVEAVAKVAGGGLVRFPAKIEATLERWRLGKNLDEMGKLFADPDAIPAFRGLINASTNGGNIAGPVGRLVAIASRGARDGGAPLQITVRPSDER